jgi:hypothetical protein
MISRELAQRSGLPIVPRIEPNPKKGEQYVAGFDSAVVIFRSVARFLQGRDCPMLNDSVFLNWALPLMQNLPQSLRAKLFRFGGWWDASERKRMSDFRAEDVSQWMVNHFPRRRYPAVAVGSANGAIAHMCCALGIPYLPHTVLLHVRQKNDPDDLQAQLDAARPYGEHLVTNNPDVRLHQMSDPSHDQPMVGQMAYFRVKQLRLGEIEKQFLDDVLEPGATVFLVDCDMKWPVHQVADRYVFQAGGAGEMPAAEYETGSPRVEEFLREQGKDRKKWTPPPANTQAPEAEWGCPDSFGQDVQQWTQEMGLRFRPIRFHDPEDVSPVVAELHRWWYKKLGYQANRLFIETFCVMEPYWCLRTGTVPYWAVFPTGESLRRSREYLQSAEPYDEITAALFSNGVKSIDQAGPDRWRELFSLAKNGGRFLGQTESAFPYDFAVFSRYQREIQKLQPQYPLPSPLTVDEVDWFLKDRGM